MGLASLLKTLWDKDYEDERDARFINDRVHANIQKDKTFSVIPQIAGGVTSAAQLRRIADVADKYQVPMVKLTGGQRIDLLGIKKRRPAQSLAGFGYAVRVRLLEVVSDVQDVRGDGLLPVRGSGTARHWASGSRSDFRDWRVPAR